MRYAKGNTPLGLSDKYKIGIELEVSNVNTSRTVRNKI